MIAANLLFLAAVSTAIFVGAASALQLPIHTIGFLALTIVLILAAVHFQRRAIDAVSKEGA
jgi:membrane protein implicated in regulation of membrane protease activity